MLLGEIFEVSTEFLVLRLLIEGHVLHMLEVLHEGALEAFVAWDEILAQIFYRGAQLGLFYLNEALLLAPRLLVVPGEAASPQEVCKDVPQRLQVILPRLLILPHSIFRSEFRGP